MGPGDSFFDIVSFEGPDDYARVGDLAARVTSLAGGLAERGYETHLYFFGDPRLAGAERIGNGHLTLHRWAQWLSATLPGGVYDGEAPRCRELAATLPRQLVEHQIGPLIRARFTPVVLAMEWQGLEFLRSLDGLLREERLRQSVVLAWELAAPSLPRVAWSEVPQGVRMVSRDPVVVNAAAAAGSTVLPLADGVEGLLIAVLGPGAQAISWRDRRPSRRSFAAAKGRR
jgi:hypothetical protein